MSNKKHSPFPWYRHPEMVIMSGEGKDVVAVAYASEEDGKLILSAVNSTYGQGINPESVKDLYEAVNKLMHYAERYLAAATIPKLYDMCFDDIKAAQTAIEKAKL